MTGPILYDHRGEPIAAPETRKIAEEKLKDYMAKHHDKFQQWFTANGLIRPPVFYNVAAGEWIWAE